MLPHTGRCRGLRGPGLQPGCRGRGGVLRLGAPGPRLPAPASRYGSRRPGHQLWTVHSSVPPAPRGPRRMGQGLPLGQGTGQGALDRERVCQLSDAPRPRLPDLGWPGAPTSQADVEGDGFIASLTHILPGVLRLGMRQGQGAGGPLSPQLQGTRCFHLQPILEPAHPGPSRGHLTAQLHAPGSPELQVQGAGCRVHDPLWRGWWANREGQVGSASTSPTTGFSVLSLCRAVLGKWYHPQAMGTYVCQMSC